MIEECLSRLSEQAVEMNVLETALVINLSICFFLAVEC